MPGDSRCDRGDYARVPFSFGPEAAGASGARHSLRPLFSEAQTFLQNLGQIMPRDRGVTSDRRVRKKDGAPHTTIFFALAAIPIPSKTLYGAARLHPG